MGRAGLIVLAVLSLMASARGTDAIVENGQSKWVILSPKDATATESFAAAELSKYVEQMSGVKLEVFDRLPEGRDFITVANQEKVAQFVLPDNFAPPRQDGAFAIVGAANAIVIGGHDSGATLHGVYVLLDELGCRFLAPQLGHYDGAGEIVPKKQTLAINQFPHAPSSPKLKFRKLYVEEGHSHNIENLRQIVEWMPKVGYNTLVVPTDYQGSHRVMWDNWRQDLTPELQKRGITIEVGGHGYQNFLNAEMEGGKLFEQHPDWFGQDKSGTRHREKGWVPCTSNAQAVDYLIGNFVAYVKDRPEIQIYDFWPPDGAKWCECDECAKLGAPSDRQAILVQQVKERVAKVRPDLRLEVLAYHTSINPPEHAKLDKDVLLDFCPISQQFDHQINDADAATNAGYAKNVAAWRKAFDGDISIYSYYRKYAWDSLPVIIPHYMQKDLQWYAGLPVQGISTYAEPGDWFTYELNYYVLAALAWDPDCDVDAVVKKFCEARYGSESNLAVAAMTSLEKIVRNDCSVPNTSLKSDEEIVAAQAEMQDLVDGLAAAQGRVSDKAVRRNLERLGLMCTYALRDLEIQHLRASKAAPAEVAEKATALHEWISSHADDGVFLINAQRLNLGRMLNRYKPSKGE